VKAARAIGLVLAAIVVGAAIGAAFLLRGGDEEAGEAGRIEGLAVRAETSLSPRSHLFGDSVVATADLFLDRRVVVPDTVRVDASFAPYEPVAAPTRERSDAGDLVRLRYRWVLRCLSQECTPLGGNRQFDFRLGRAEYRLALGGLAADAFDWPTLEVATRVSPFDVERASWRAEVRELPDVSYRLSPTVLGASLLGGAVVLVLAASAIAVRLVPRRRRADEVEDEAPRLTALDRALALVAETSSNGSVPERRQALERLARELGETPLAELEGRARRLAWSQEPPSPAAAQSLAEDVREAARSDA
jgi:hypothetical protein